MAEAMASDLIRKKRDVPLKLRLIPPPLDKFSLSRRQPLINYYLDIPAQKRIRTKGKRRFKGRYQEILERKVMIAFPNQLELLV
jgi:hypothetical protein